MGRTKELWAQKVLNEEKKTRKKRHKKVKTIPEIVNSLKEIFSRKYFEGMEQGIGEVSASKLTTYLGCPFAYMLIYEVKISPLRSPQMASGSDIHSIIEHINKGKYPNLEEVLNGIKDEKGKVILPGWYGKWSRTMHSKDVNFSNENEKFIYRNAGAKMLTNFFEDNKDMPLPNPNLVERKVRFFHEGYHFVAKMDAIHITPKIILDLDFKSGWKPPSNVYVTSNYQLSIYELACRKLKEEPFKELPKRKPIVHGIYHLRSRRIFPTKRDGWDIRRMMKKIKEVDKKIKTLKSVSSFEEFINPFIGFHCDGCNVEKICYPILTYIKNEYYKKK